MLAISVLSLWSARPNALALCRESPTAATWAERLGEEVFLRLLERVLDRGLADVESSRDVGSHGSRAGIEGFDVREDDDDQGVIVPSGDHGPGGIEQLVA